MSQKQRPTREEVLLEYDELLAEVKTARERLGPAGYKIIQDCARYKAALEKIRDGGIPFGELATVPERMMSMCAIAGEALAEDSDNKSPQH